MSYPVKLSDLQARVLQCANMEGAGDFISPAELTSYINSSIAKWVDEVRGTTWNGQYSRSSFPFTTSQGKQTYPLPGDLVTLLSVDISIAGGTPVISAVAYQEEQRNAFLNYPLLGGWGVSAPIYYQLQGNNISFIPIPQGQYSVTLNYVPTAPVLTDPDDYIDSVNGWEEFIVLDAAIKCLIKSGGSPLLALLTQRLQEERERIRAMAPRRDQQTAEQVHTIANAGFLSDWDW